MGLDRSTSPAPLDDVERAACEAQKMHESHAAREEVLRLLASAGEKLAGEGSAVSILIIDEEGLLRNGASPNLPLDYLAAIDRLEPNANVGTCAAAAATGCPVITPDFLADDKWAELRHLPAALGYVGAWSMPIKSGDGKVLGTFGTYYREKRVPTSDEQRGVERLANTAALVLSDGIQ